MSTLRDILERAHACEPLLAFAKRPSARNDHPYACAYAKVVGGTCSCSVGPYFFKTFAELWHAIERHDWLTWLMRHCQDQFEDSWRDCVSALHALCEAYSLISDEPEGNERGQRACDLIRQYVRLRA